MIALDQCTLAWLRDAMDVPVGLYEFPGDQDCAAFSPSPIHEMLGAYKAGGGTYAYTYEVHLRVRPKDAADRAAAVQALHAVCSGIAAREFPLQPAGCVWLGHEVTQRPTLFEVYDDGLETYRIVARITYIELS